MQIKQDQKRVDISSTIEEAVAIVHTSFRNAGLKGIQPLDGLEHMVNAMQLFAEGRSDQIKGDKTWRGTVALAHSSYLMCEKWLELILDEDWEKFPSVQDANKYPTFPDTAGLSDAIAALALGQIEAADRAMSIFCEDVKRCLQNA